MQVYYTLFSLFCQYISSHIPFNRTFFNKFCFSAFYFNAIFIKTVDFS